VDLDALLTVADAASAADVTEDLIRQWAHRYPHEMPVRKRYGPRRRPLYRAGDVYAVERETRRAHAA
jgi:hypothetical protein